MFILPQVVVISQYSQQAILSFVWGGAFLMIAAVLLVVDLLKVCISFSLGLSGLCVPRHFSTSSVYHSLVYPGNFFTKLSDIQFFLLLSAVIS
jgi:hypothetical protein